jgi:hypothetical protein
MSTRQVDKAKSDKVREYIIQNCKLQDYFKEMQIELINESSQGDSKIKASCVFDDADAVPSFFVDFSKNIYHCFSCGRAGGYIKFVRDYLFVHDGIKLSYTQTIERILTDNPDIQNATGVTTIYFDSADSNKYASFDDKGNLNLVLPVCRKPHVVSNITLKKVVEHLKAENNLIRIADFISDCENDKPLKYIIGKYYNNLMVEHLEPVDDASWQKEFNETLGELL